MSKKQSAQSVSVDSGGSAPQSDSTSLGRGDLPARIAHLCSKHVGEAVDVLVSLMRTSERDMVRLQAAKVILDAARELPADGAEAPQAVIYVLPPGEKAPVDANVVDMATVDAEAEKALRGPD